MKKISLVIICLFLTSCFQNSQTSEKTSLQSQKVSVEVPTKEEKTFSGASVVAGREGNYTLTIPKGFVSDVGTGEVLDVSFVEEKQRMSLYTVVEAKEGLEVSTMEEYEDIVMENFKGLEKSSLKDEIKNPNSYKVLDKKYTGNFQGEEVTMYTRLVDTGTFYIQIIAATDPKKLDENMKKMLEIIESFTLKK